jgi:mono/diheme cytochrome c family protein
MCIGGFVLYLTGCSKTSEDKLAASTTCDTTNVKYSVQIASILSDNCYECHKGAGVATSGIDLGDYAHFKVHVDNGDVRSAITHDGRVTPMPYQRAQLPSCEIETILAWINAGAQNN